YGRTQAGSDALRAWRAFIFPALRGETYPAGLLRKQYKKKEKLIKIERAKERGFWKTSFDLTWGLFFFLIAFDFFRSIMDNTESTFQEMVNRAGPSAGSIFYLIMFFIGSLLLSVLSNILRFSWWKIKDKFKK
ncbi:hypothetical protein J4435_05865, partial [Candidatus Woesearchaeota archaeon]|nr:hypothetical protein [Candidatus Woesearchaeota archaeon]